MNQASIPANAGAGQPQRVDDGKGYPTEAINSLLEGMTDGYRELLISNLGDRLTTMEWGIRSKDDLRNLWTSHISGAAIDQVIYSKMMDLDPWSHVSPADFKLWDYGDFFHRLKEEQLEKNDEATQFWLSLRPKLAQTRSEFNVFAREFSEEWGFTRYGQGDRPVNRKRAVNLRPGSEPRLSVPSGRSSMSALQIGPSNSGMEYQRRIPTGDIALQSLRDRYELDQRGAIDPHSKFASTIVSNGPRGDRMTTALASASVSSLSTGQSKADRDRDFLYSLMNKNKSKQAYHSEVSIRPPRSTDQERLVTRYTASPLSATPLIPISDAQSTAGQTSPTGNDVKRRKKGELDPMLPSAGSTPRLTRKASMSSQALSGRDTLYSPKAERDEQNLWHPQLNSNRGSNDSPSQNPTFVSAHPGIRQNPSGLPATMRMETALSSHPPGSTGASMAGMYSIQPAILQPAKIPLPQPRSQTQDASSKNLGQIQRSIPRRPINYSAFANSYFSLQDKMNYLERAFSRLPQMLDMKAGINSKQAGRFDKAKEAIARMELMSTSQIKMLIPTAIGRSFHPGETIIRGNPFDQELHNDARPEPKLDSLGTTAFLDVNPLIGDVTFGAKCTSLQIDLPTSIDGRSLPGLERRSRWREALGFGLIDDDVIRVQESEYGTRTKVSFAEVANMENAEKWVRSWLDREEVGSSC